MSGGQSTVKGGGLKTALILDHRLEAVADAELFMENAAAVVDMRSIVAMLNAKLIKISTRRHLKPRFLAHLCAFSPIRHENIPSKSK